MTETEPRPLSSARTSIAGPSLLRTGLGPRLLHLRNERLRNARAMASSAAERDALKNAATAPKRLRLLRHPAARGALRFASSAACSARSSSQKAAQLWPKSRLYTRMPLGPATRQCRRSGLPRSRGTQAAPEGRARLSAARPRVACAGGPSRTPRAGPPCAAGLPHSSSAEAGHVHWGS